MSRLRTTFFFAGVLLLVSGMYHFRAYLGISTATGEPGFGYRWPAVAKYGSLVFGFLGLLLAIKATIAWDRVPLGILKSNPGKGD